MHDHMLEMLDSAGNGLRIVFNWGGDRFGHKVFALDVAGAKELLASVEGSDLDIWPASPPLQQLSIEKIRSEVSVAFLLGMAGQSHWSVSVEPHPEASGFVFDAACRVGGLGRNLYSSYFASGDVKELDAHVMIQAGRFRLCIEVLDASGLVNCDRSAGRVAIRPIATDAKTARWRYALRLLSGP